MKVVLGPVDFLSLYFLLFVGSFRFVLGHGLFEFSERLAGRPAIVFAENFEDVGPLHKWRNSLGQH